MTSRAKVAVLRTTPATVLEDYDRLLALAEVERTGATVLAEGIESRRHEATAHAMGATLGQGWRYGQSRVRKAGYVAGAIW